jgi:hypothetical protein
MLTATVVVVGAGAGTGADVGVVSVWCACADGGVHAFTLGTHRPKCSLTWQRRRRTLRRTRFEKRGCNSSILSPSSLGGGVCTNPRLQTRNRSHPSLGTRLGRRQAGLSAAPLPGQGWDRPLDRKSRSRAGFMMAALPGNGKSPTAVAKAERLTLTLLCWLVWRVKVCDRPLSKGGVRCEWAQRATFTFLLLCHKDQRNSHEPRRQKVMLWRWGLT